MGGVLVVIKDCHWGHCNSDILILEFYLEHCSNASPWLNTTWDQLQEDNSAGMW